MEAVVIEGGNLFGLESIKWVRSTTLSLLPTNNIGCYRYAYKMVMPVFCKYIKNNIKVK